MCLDIKVLDENMEVIELSEDEEEETDFNNRAMPEETASGTDAEFAEAGFGINDAEEGDTDLGAFDSAAEEAGTDDDFADEDNYGDGDFDE